MTAPADPVAANKALAVRWLELIGAGDVETLCALAPPDWTMIGGPPDLPPGPAGIRALFASFGEIADGAVRRIWRNAADLQRLLQLGARIVPPNG